MMPLSKYAAKQRRKAEELLLAEEEPEEPEVQPEPHPIEHVDGLGDVPALDTFDPEQLARYHALVRGWQAQSRRMHPGSKARRSMRARALGITS